MVVAQRDRQAGLLHAVDQQPRRGALPRFPPHLDHAPALRWVTTLLGKPQIRLTMPIPFDALQQHAPLTARILLPVHLSPLVGASCVDIGHCPLSTSVVAS